MNLSFRVCRGTTYGKLRGKALDGQQVDVHKFTQVEQIMICLT